MSRGPRRAARPLPVRGPRLWLFRAAALALLPLALLCLEAALRLLGVGAATGFLVNTDPPGQHLRSNPRFGERFFPPTLARPPVPFLLDEPKADDVYRIFVVGGSAARGTPEPAFGVPRVLEALLELRYPERRVEVVNAAITAINSHVALPIVEDVVDRGDADLVLVYLGNNEVVGPWGAASVLGEFSPSRRVIRAGIALRQWRGVQLLDKLVAPPPPRSGWRGMGMFLGQRVTANDPRLGDVYAHFSANLEAMVKTARSADVPIALSTVAVNLRHQAPFASEGDDGDAAVRGQLDRARRAITRGDPAAGLALAEQLLDGLESHAEGHFVRGSALLALGQTLQAREAFERARDLDTLRFRADGKINDRIRDVAGRLDVPLVDAAESFAAQLPGRRFFLEHVHLRFEGNFALARLLGEAVDAALPAGATDASTTTGEIAASAVARRLAFTPEDALAIERDMLELVRRPPFTESVDALARRHAQVQRLRQLTGADGARLQVEAAYAERLEAKPDDLQSRRRRAEIFELWGQPDRALEDRKYLATALPDLRAWRRALAVALSRSGDSDAATAVLEQALGDAARDVRAAAELRIDLGGLHEAAGRLREAGEQYRLAAELDPGNPLPAFNVAMLAAQRGQIGTAVKGFEAVVAEHPDFAPAWHNLGVAHEKNGDLDAAERAYRGEMAARPDAGGGAYRLGLLELARGRAEAASEAFAEAVRRQGDHAPSYFRLGELHLAAGRPREAVEIFRLGLRFKPRAEAGQQGLRLARVQVEAETAPKAPTGN